MAIKAFDNTAHNIIQHSPYFPLARLILVSNRWGVIMKRMNELLHFHISALQRTDTWTYRMTTSLKKINTHLKGRLKDGSALEQRFREKDEISILRYLGQRTIAVSHNVTIDLTTFIWRERARESCVCWTASSSSSRWQTDRQQEAAPSAPAQWCNWWRKQRGSEELSTSYAHLQRVFAVLHWAKEHDVLNISK